MKTPSACGFERRNWAVCAPPGAGAQPQERPRQGLLAPDIGEQVAVLLDARGEDGVVLGAIFSAADAVPVVSRDKWHRRFADGAILEYDRAAHQLTVRGGVSKVVVEAGAEITLKAGAKVSIDAPATEISGTLLVRACSPTRAA